MGSGENRLKQRERRKVPGQGPPVDSWWQWWVDRDDPPFGRLGLAVGPKSTCSVSASPASRAVCEFCWGLGRLPGCGKNGLLSPSPTRKRQLRNKITKSGCFLSLF